MSPPADAQTLSAEELPPSASLATAGPSFGSQFIAMTPTRVLDTRRGLGTTGGKPAARSVTDVVIRGVAGVAADATAVAVNLTATESTAPGFVQIFPTSASEVGSSSTLNVEYTNQTLANIALVAIGDGGRISIFTQAGAHLVLDVVGYFIATDDNVTGGRFVPVEPTRLLDSRIGAGAFNANPGDTKDCTDFPDWPQANKWFWTYYTQWGDVGNLDTNDNLVPCESLPGKSPETPPRAPRDLFKLGPNTPTRLKVRNVAQPPIDHASAVALNVTAVEAAQPGYVQLVGTGGLTPLGATSSLNVDRAGHTVANLVIVPIGDDGTVTVMAEHATHVIADVVGYFTDSTAALSRDGLFSPIQPVRFLDTRINRGTSGGFVEGGSAVTFGVGGRTHWAASNANAAFLNVTITQAAEPGFVQVFATGEATVGAFSNLNVTTAGQTVANAAIASVGAGDATVSVYTEGGAHVVADVAGYFIRDSATLLAVGDIASCSTTADEAVAALLFERDGTIATLGDTVYASGTAAEFLQCFDPAWGRLRGRIRPAAGNHDYLTAGGAAYYAYFGSAAGDPAKGYYSYEAGPWHVIVLNSNCAEVGGCSTGSAQDLWLHADLAAHPTKCTLAYWHHARFSSSAGHGSDATYQPFWQALYEGGADIVLNGHDHDYERFAPQTPDGQPDPTRGIRQFVVGTGGAPLYAFAATAPNSEVRNATTYGTLELTLTTSGYTWQFMPAAGGSFTDSGSDLCH